MLLWRRTLRWGRLSGLPHSQRLERRLINRRGHIKTVVALIVRKRRAGNRSQGAVDRAVVVALRLQRGLNICDDLIGRQIVVGVNGAVIWVVGVSRIVTPRRIPIAGIPKIPATTEQTDAVVIVVPPTLIVPLAPVVLESAVLLALPVLTALNAIVLVEPRACNPLVRRIGK